jgi:hypothetical protein
VLTGCRHQLRLSSRRRPGPNFFGERRTSHWAPAFAGVTNARISTTRPVPPR